MLYTEQKLATETVTGQFEVIKNFKIDKPKWKESYGNEFYLGPRKKLNKKWTNTKDIVDTANINGDIWTVSISEDKTKLNVSTKDTLVYSNTLGQSHRILSMRGGTGFIKSGSITSVGEEDPTNKDTTDVFQDGYIKLKLDIPALIGNYITFISNETNLQTITSRIHYIEGGFVYIRGTNLYGTLPLVGQTIHLNSKINDVPIVAFKDTVELINTDGTTIEIFKCDTDDEIIDIEYYNNVLFILTNKFVLFSRRLVNSNTNIYPLDFFDNMINGDRLIAFGKMLIMIGENGQIITPVTGTSGSLGYIPVDLNYNHHLFSKYSILSNQGSLYAIQDDKTFVKLDIVNNTNTFYDVVVTDLLDSVQGMLDEIKGEVFISKSDKYISIINYRDGTTYTYNYNVLYKYWNTWEYEGIQLRSLGYDKYGDTLYEESNRAVDSNDIQQELSFVLGSRDTHTLKNCKFVKFVLELEQGEVPDYEVQIDTYLGGLLSTEYVDLNSYPIDEHIKQDNMSLGGSLIGHIELGAQSEREILSRIITPQIAINKLGDLFRFTLRNKKGINTIKYGGSIIGYSVHAPESVHYNYQIEVNNDYNKQHKERKKFTEHQQK